MAFDAAGRAERRWFANPVAGESTEVPAYFVYNQVSEMTLCDDRLKGVDVSYFDRDVMGRLAKKATLAGAVYYAFDLSGRRSSLKDAGLAENLYVYDEAGRLAKQQLQAGRTIYFAYDRSGKLTKRLLPGGESGLPHRVMTYMFYDSAGRTQRIESRGSAYDTLINYFHYERNQSSFPTWIRREEDRNVYYQWDALDRLYMEQQITGSTINFNDYYTWDLHGNKMSKLNTVSGQQTDSVYDTRNLLSKSHVIGGATIYFDFDASQRMQARRITDGTSSHYFTYDQIGRMEKVELLPPIGATDAFQLFHNAVGERVFKKDANAATPAYLAWDGKSVIMHRTGGGSTVIRYRFSPIPGAPIADLVEYDPVAFGTPKQLAAGDLSVRKLMQDGGAAYSYYNYDAFGATKTFVVGSGLTSNYHLRFRPDRKYNSVTLGDHITGDADGSFESNDQVRGIGPANMGKPLREGFFGPGCGGMMLCGDNSSAVPLPVDDSGIAQVGGNRVPLDPGLSSPSSGARWSLEGVWNWITSPGRRTRYAPPSAWDPSVSPLGVDPVYVPEYERPGRVPDLRDPRDVHSWHDLFFASWALLPAIPAKSQGVEIIPTRGQALENAVEQSLGRLITRVEGPSAGSGRFGVDFAPPAILGPEQLSLFNVGAVESPRVAGLRARITAECQTAGPGRCAPDATEVAITLVTGQRPLYGPETGVDFIQVVRTGGALPEYRGPLNLSYFTNRLQAAGLFGPAGRPGELTTVELGLLPKGARWVQGSVIVSGDPLVMSPRSELLGILQQQPEGTVSIVTYQVPGLTGRAGSHALNSVIIKGQPVLIDSRVPLGGYESNILPESAIFGVIQVGTIHPEYAPIGQGPSQPQESVVRFFGGYGDPMVIA